MFEISEPQISLCPLIEANETPPVLWPAGPKATMVRGLTTRCRVRPYIDSRRHTLELDRTFGRDWAT